MSPQVTLPKEIEKNLSNANLVYAMLPTSSHTLGIYDEDWLHAIHDKDAMVIDISELKASDLFTKLDCTYQDSNNKLEFDEKRSPLLKALKNAKTVVLKGAWSSELAATLHPLLVERSLSNAPCGKLILLHDNKELFPIMPEAIKNNVLHHQEKAFIQTKAEFDERFEKVDHVLKDSCFVLLSGPTGAGKTHFVQNDWQQGDPHCHYGESSIEKWARDRRLGIKTLFIDEANITNRQWSELEGLFNTPPALYINAKYIPLTSSYKVIFAGNPNNYGGGKADPKLF